MFSNVGNNYLSNKRMCLVKCSIYYFLQVNSGNEPLFLFNDFFNDNFFAMNIF